MRKGKQDAKRANAFAKLSKNIMVAARKGPDPDSNFGLRHAIELARAQSMPKDNIEHAVKKGAGLLDGAKLKVDHRGRARDSYSFRHFYISQQLIAGVDVFALARNCGTSPDMIDKFYGQVSVEQLKDQLRPQWR